MGKRVISLELNDRVVSQTEVIKERGKVRLLNWQCLELPPKVIENGIIEDLDCLIQNVKLLWSSRAFFKPVPTVMGISGLQAFIRKFFLPIVPSKELKKIIRWEGESILPYPIEKVIYNYQLMEKTSAGYQILFTAVLQERLKKYFQLFQKLKLPVEILSLQPFGIVNFAEYIGVLDHFDGIMLRITEGECDLIVIYHGEVELVRTISISGLSHRNENNQITNSGSAHTKEKWHNLDVINNPEEINRRDFKDWAIYHGDKLESLLIEIISTLEHYQSLKDVWLNSGLYFGPQSILADLRTEMPTFHWRHLIFDPLLISGPETLSNEFVEHCPTGIGLALMGVV